MDIDVFGKIAVELFSSKIVTAPIDFLWHLGEPLAVPISFYEKAFKIISQLGEGTGIEYSITFQTNAMLITQSWIDLFKKYKINIGVSIDGPAFIHDKKRVNKKNRGTHEQVMKGVGMLQEARIPFGVIMVVTKDSLDYPDLICDFFLENGINDIGFNIDEMDGDNLKSSFEKIEDEKFKFFIQQLLKRSVESNGKFKVREFWLNIRPFTAEVNEPVNVANRPFGIFNFDCYGNYSTFCPELITAKNEKYNNFVMGNVLTDKLDDILTNPIYLRVKREIEEGIEKCKNSCDYWSFCGGGCPSNKYFENGTFISTDTVACKYHKKMIVDALADHLEQQFS